MLNAWASCKLPSLLICAMARETMNVSASELKNPGPSSNLQSSVVTYNYLILKDLLNYGAPKMGNRTS